MQSRESVSRDEGVTNVVRRPIKTINKVLGIFLGLFASLASVAAAYISYRQSRLEATTANKRTMVEAESGYAALKDYAEILQRISNDQEARIAENAISIRDLKESDSALALKVQQLEDLIVSRKHVKKDDALISDETAIPVQSQPREEPPPVKYIQKTLPKTLKEAAPQELQGTPLKIH